LLAALTGTGPWAAAAIRLTISATSIGPERTIQLQAASDQAGLPEWHWTLLEPETGADLSPAAEALDGSDVRVTFAAQQPLPALLRVRVEDARPGGSAKEAIIWLNALTRMIQAASAADPVPGSGPSRAFSARAHDLTHLQRRQIIGLLDADGIVEAEALLPFVDPTAPDPGLDLARALCRCGVRQVRSGDLVAAERLLQKALARVDRAVDPGHAKYVTLSRVLPELIQIHSRSGQAEAAASLEERLKNLTMEWPQLAPPHAPESPDPRDLPTAPPLAPARASLGRYPATVPAAAAPPRIANRDRGLTVSLDAGPALPHARMDRRGPGLQALAARRPTQGVQPLAVRTVSGTGQKRRHQVMAATPYPACPSAVASPDLPALQPAQRRAQGSGARPSVPGFDGHLPGSGPGH
jgi:hypothetical protein